MQLAAPLNHGILHHLGSSSSTIHPDAPDSIVQHLNIWLLYRSVWVRVLDPTACEVAETPCTHQNY